MSSRPNGWHSNCVIVPSEVFMSHIAKNSLKIVSIALLACLGMSGNASESSGTIPSLLVGGAFTTIGEPRLPLLGLPQGLPIGEAVAVSGVRATIRAGKSYVIAGTFTAVNGEPRAGLARLDSMGRLDRDWQPRVSGTIHALAAIGDRLYIGGEFSAINDEERANLACLSLNDGAVDKWKSNTDAAVFALAARGTTVIAGGSFTVINGESHVRIARLNTTDGTPDPAFTAGADSDVRALVIRDPHLYIGGQFSRINAEDRVGLARLDLMSGAVDSDWRADVDGAVFALSAAWDNLYVAGAFSAISNQNRNHCARVSLKSALPDSWHPEADDQVTAIAELDGGRILLGGRFTSINGEPVPGLALVNTTDAKAIGGWKNPAMSAHQPPTGFALNGEQVLVASSSVTGLQRSGCAWLDRHGVTTGPGTVLDGTRPRVLATLEHRGKIYLGGDFTMVDGLPRMNLARIDLATGKLDPTWRCDANGPIRAFALDGDDVIAGGDFTQLQQEPRTHIGRIALADATLKPWKIELNGTIMTLLTKNKSLLIGGNFTSVGGLSYPGLARVDLATALPDPTFKTDLQDGPNPGVVHVLQEISPDTLVVAGRFTSASAASAGNIALIDSRSGSRLPWSITVDGPVFACAFSGGKLVLGGGFKAITGVPRSNLAQVEAMTGKVTAWRADTDAEVRSLAMVGDDLWVAGDFTTIAQRPQHHLACLSWLDASAKPAPSADERVDHVAPIFFTPVR